MIYNSDSISLYMRVLVVLIFSGGILFINACAASAGYNSSIMDTALNQKIIELEKSDHDSVIQFTGKTRWDIDDQMKDQLEDAGINIETAAGDIFTASGNISGVKKVSLIDFVVSLELVKKLDLS